MSFRRFFLVRLGWAVFGLWLAATIVFLMFFVAQRSPYEACRRVEVRQACFEYVRTQYHLESPLHERYAFFVWRLVRHQSAGRSTVSLDDSREMALKALPATLSIVVPALALAFVISAWLGIALARVRWRRMFNLPLYVAFGLTPIVVGFLLAYHVGFRWWNLDAFAYCDFFDPPKDLGCGGGVDWATHLVLPVVTFSLFVVAVYTRVIRAGVVGVLAAKNGSKDRRKRRRRLALMLARSVGRDFGFLLGLAMFVEYVFGIPGIGNRAIFSIAAEDFVGLQAYVLYATFLAVSVHFLVDVVAGALDAEVRADWPFARL